VAAWRRCVRSVRGSGRSAPSPAGTSAGMHTSHAAPGPLPTSRQAPQTLKASRLDASYDAEMRKLIGVELLLVDDFSLQPLDATETPTSTGWSSMRRRSWLAPSECPGSGRPHREWLGSGHLLRSDSSTAPNSTGDGCISKGFVRRTDSPIGVRHFVRRLLPFPPGSTDILAVPAQFAVKPAIMLNRPRMAKTLAFEPRAVNPDGNRRRGKREFRGSLTNF